MERGVFVEGDNIPLSYAPRGLKFLDFSRDRVNDHFMLIGIQSLESDDHKMIIHLEIG